MYLLWQPGQLSSSGTPSIPVPIGYQYWNFVASAFQDPPIGNDHWNKHTTLTASGDDGEGFEPAQATDNAVYGYPQWNSIVSTDCGVSQTIDYNALHGYSPLNYTPSTDYRFGKEEQ
jgi:hypothetical protein